MLRMYQAVAISVITTMITAAAAAVPNRLIPPNVFYFERDGIAAKYAVLSEGDFYRLNGPETSSVSVWARFADQQSGVVCGLPAPASSRAQKKTDCQPYIQSIESGYSPLQGKSPD